MLPRETFSNTRNRIFWVAGDSGDVGDRRDPNICGFRGLSMTRLMLVGLKCVGLMVKVRNRSNLKPGDWRHEQLETRSSRAACLTFKL